MPFVWHLFSPQTMESSTLRLFEDSTNALTAPEEIATSTRAVREGLRPTVGSPMALRKRRSCSTLMVEGACCIMDVLMEGRDCQQSHNQLCPAILVSVNVLNYEVEMSRDAPSVATFNCYISCQDPSRGSYPPLCQLDNRTLEVELSPDWGMLRRSRRVQICFSLQHVKQNQCWENGLRFRAEPFPDTTWNEPGPAGQPSGHAYPKQNTPRASESQERSNGGAYSPYLTAHYGSVARGARSQASCAAKRARHLLRSGSWS